MAGLNPRDTDPDLELFEGGLFADGTVLCRGRTWKVHRNILATRNKWFRRAFCGSMMEAKTGQVVLEDQDPDVVDILLRFIYAKDLDLATLRGGQQTPALCVQLFRVADFFLHDALKRDAVTELRRYLHNTPTFHDVLLEGEQTPVWVKEVLPAIREVYNDPSTEPISEGVLSFAYLNIHAIFGTDEGRVLLNDTPGLKAHLRGLHANGGVVASGRSDRIILGLRVFTAVDPQHLRVYDGESAGVQCHLYPVAGDRPSTFKATDANTEQRIPSLDWVVPPADEVRKLTGNDDSAVVLVRTVATWEAGRLVYIRFGSCVDARLYIARFQQANPAIMSAHMPADMLYDGIRSVWSTVSDMKGGAQVLTGGQPRANAP